MSEEEGESWYSTKYSEKNPRGIIPNGALLSWLWYGVVAKGL